MYILLNRRINSRINSVMIVHSLRPCLTQKYFCTVALCTQALGIGWFIQILIVCQPQQADFFFFSTCFPWSRKILSSILLLCSLSLFSIIFLSRTPIASSETNRECRQGNNAIYLIFTNIGIIFGWSDEPAENIEVCAQLSNVFDREFRICNVSFIG